MQVFLRAAGQEGRDKLGQILSVLWWWPTSSLARSVTCTADTEPSAGAAKGRMTALCWTGIVPDTCPQHHVTCHGPLHIQSSTRAPANGSLLNDLSVFISLLTMNGTEGTGICSVSVSSVFPSFLSPATCTTFLKKY